MTVSIGCMLWNDVQVSQSVSDHQLLAHSLVNSCTKIDGKYIRRWNGELPVEAEKLLDYHALLRNISTLQRAYL